MPTCKFLPPALLAALLSLPATSAAQPGFYVTFSGESSRPINNVYALSASGQTVSTAVLDPTHSYRELRGMAFGPDGKLYVSQAYKNDSAILRLSSTVAPGSHVRSFLGSYVTPASSSGLAHPYQPAFGADGNLYVTSQDTDVTTAFYGPASTQAGRAMPTSPFLQKNYPSGKFNPGTFVAASSAAKGVPKFTSVPASKGGLTFDTAGGTRHSVRGLAFDNAGHLFVADEGLARVAVYDAASGVFLGAIIKSSNHSIQDPVALVFNPASSILYIGSAGNQRVFTYDVSKVAKGDLKAGVLIHDSKRLAKLSGITLDAGGNLYTCSRKSNRIYKWSPTGTSPILFAGAFTDSPEQMIPVADLGG